MSQKHFNSNKSQRHNFVVFAFAIFRQWKYLHSFNVHAIAPVSVYNVRKLLLFLFSLLAKKAIKLNWPQPGHKHTKAHDFYGIRKASFTSAFRMWNCEHDRMHTNPPIRYAGGTYWLESSIIRSLRSCLLFNFLPPSPSRVSYIPSFKSHFDSLTKSLRRIEQLHGIAFAYCVDPGVIFRRFRTIKSKRAHILISHTHMHM